MGCMLIKPAVVGVGEENDDLLMKKAQLLYRELRRSLDRSSTIIADDSSDSGVDDLDTILELKMEILGNPYLCNLVKEYINISVKVARSFASLKECFLKAHRYQEILHDALELFKKDQEKGSNKNRMIVIEKLSSFMEARDPFTEPFMDEFGSVCEQQKSMLETLNLQKVEIDGKLSSVKAWRKGWDFIYRTAFAAVLICSVVLAAVVVPHVATAAATAVATAMGSVERWINSLWDGHEAELGVHKDLISKMRDGSFSSLHDLGTVRLLVERLKILIFQHGEFTLLEEAVPAATMTDVMEEITNKLGEYAKSLEEMEKEVDKCNKEFQGAITLVLGAITG